MKNAFWIFMLSLLFIGCGKGTLLPSDAKEQTSPIAVTLSVQNKEVNVGGPIHLTLNVKNQSGAKVSLVRPTSKTMTRIHEHGWGVEITGPQGAYGLFPEPRAARPVLDTDIVELAPGDFLEVNVKVHRYVLLKRTERPRQEVGKTPGVYRAVAKYSLRKDEIFFLKGRDVNSLFLGPISSKEVEFKVINNE